MPESLPFAHVRLAYCARTCSKSTSGISIHITIEHISETPVLSAGGGDRDFPTISNADPPHSGSLLLELISTGGDGTDCVTVILALLFESTSYKEWPYGDLGLWLTRAKKIATPGPRARTKPRATVRIRSQTGPPTAVGSSSPACLRHLR